MNYDKRAVKILFDAYWGSKGWKSTFKPGWAPETPPDDLAYATEAGLMFPPRKFSHDDALQQLVALRAVIHPEQVGSAYVASLSTNQPALRSALGSYAVALNMPLHPLRASRSGISCSICGAYEIKGEHDLNVLNFERHKWGGVRHADPAYIAFDLDRFISEPNEAPSAEDRQILNSILESVESAPSGAKLSDLLKAIKQVVPGNEAQRRTILGILGYAGVLRIPEYPSFLISYTAFNDRKETPWSKDDWPYPTRWWRGGSGIDRDAVAFWFGS
jgi:hypothetical protein